MSRPRPPARRGTLWLDPGPEVCGHCLQRYCIEAAFYCADCDEPVCPFCALILHGRQVVLCPECGAASERGSER